MTGPLWVVFRAQNYCFGCLFGNPIIFMGLFLGPLFLWVCFWAGIIFLGQIFIRMTFFCLLKLKFHYFYGYLFGQNYFYGSFFARQIIFFGTGKISGAGHPRHFGILTTPPEFVVSWKRSNNQSTINLIVLANEDWKQYLCFNFLVHMRYPGGTCIWALVVRVQRRLTNTPFIMV